MASTEVWGQKIWDGWDGARGLLTEGSLGSG